MFKDLTETEKQAFINSLTEGDLSWLDFLLIHVYGGMMSAAMERLYRDKMATQPH